LEEPKGWFLEGNSGGQPFLFAMNHLKGNPQLENGYTRIANELFEAIIEYPFTCAELRIILLIIRRTYGWKTSKSYISYGSVARKLQMDIRYVKRRISKLISECVLLKDKTEWENRIGLNKQYTSWQLWKSGSARNSRPLGSGLQATGK
jgi:phage replication O-like protein O